MAPSRTRESPNPRLDYSAHDAKKVLWFLLAVEVFLAAVYICTRILAPDARVGPLRNFFDVDREVSIPTWFSSVQLFAVAVVVWSEASLTKELTRFFVVLGCGFLFLSMDEAAAVHDSLFRAAKNTKISWLQGVEYLAWMVPYAIAGVAGLLLGFRPGLTLWRRFRHEAILIALGGVLFVAGGVGIEILTHFLYRIAVDTNFYLAVAAEEFCEMAGVSVMLYGFLLLGTRLRAESAV